MGTQQVLRGKQINNHSMRRTPRKTLGRATLPIPQFWKTCADEAMRVRSQAPMKCVVHVAINHHKCFASGSECQSQPSMVKIKLIALLFCWEGFVEKRGEKEKAQFDWSSAWNFFGLGKRKAEGCDFWAGSTTNIAVKVFFWCVVCGPVSWWLRRAVLVSLGCEIRWLVRGGVWLLLDSAVDGVAAIWKESWAF
jgi:hypothetical protein